MRAHIQITFAVVLVSSFLPSRATAQADGNLFNAPTDAQTSQGVLGSPGASLAQAAQTTGGPMGVERLHSGFMVAPDFKATLFDKKVSPLAGGYAGWVTDDTIFIGGAGYWLANGSSDRRLAYGGLVVQWLTNTDRPVGFSVKGLIGGGQATLTSTVNEVVYPFGGSPFGDFDPGQRGPMQPPTPTTVAANVRFREDFFLVEPEADVLFRLGHGVRLTAGLGYRAVSAEHGDDSRIRGATGSIALQIGGR